MEHEVPSKVESKESSSKISIDKDQTPTMTETPPETPQRSKDPQMSETKPSSSIPCQGNAQVELTPSNPDDNSLHKESIAQGFPPVQVAPSVEHFHAGHLGEVTLRGGTVTQTRK